MALEPGQMIPDLTLPDLLGNRVSLSDARGNENQVLIFTGAGDGAALERLLAEISARRLEFLADPTRVIFIAPRQSENVARLRAAAGELDFPMLLDQDGEAHQRFGALDPDGRPALAVFVTDRFCELYAAILPGDAAWPPGAETLLDWLQFIEIQCPE